MDASENTTIEIPLTGGAVALIDKADLAIVSRYENWQVLRQRGLEYAKTDTSRKTDPNWIRGQHARSVRMHRLIMGVTDSQIDVDHRNGNGLDNRRANLRLATRTQNLGNMKPHINTSSRFKGVSWDKNRAKWRATIRHCNIWRQIGRFETEQEAAQAYNAAAIVLFGEFARLNIV